MVDGSLFSSSAMCLRTSFLVTMPNSFLCGGRDECVWGGYGGVMTYPLCEISTWRIPSFLTISTTVSMGVWSEI